MSRDEVLKAFAPLLQRLGQGPAPVATRAEAAEQARARESVERAVSYTVESIIKTLADLQVNLGTAIDGLAEKLQQEAGKLGELRSAETAESQRLSDLRSTRIAAEALEILIQDHKKNIQTLDDRANHDRQDLDDKIAKQRDAWAREAADLAAAAAEASAALGRTRQGQEEQYAYEIDRQRKLSADEFNEAQRVLTRDLAEAEASKVKNWSEREAKLAAAAAEIEALRTQVAAQPQKVEDETKKARERAIARVTAEAKHEAELQQRENAANSQVFELRIKSLEDRIARQVTQIDDLHKQLGVALEQTQNLAQKAIEGTSGGKR